MTYLPSLWTRLWELWTTLWHVWYPPSAIWKEGDVLLVLDAIQAYDSLFTPKHLTALEHLLESAKANQVPVLFTQWSRVDKSRQDPVDDKGHWSDYVDATERSLLIPATPEDRTADVAFTNAFCAPEVVDFTKDAKRIVLAGGWAESCILDTARTAQQRGLHGTVVVKEATVGHSRDWLPSLLKLQLLYADVVSHMEWSPKEE